MKKRISILIDWENLRKEITHLQKRHIISQSDLNYNNVDQIYNLVSFLSEEADIFRIFFYTSLPLTISEIQEKLQNRRDIDYSRYQQYYSLNRAKIDNLISITRQFFSEIDKKPNVAVRYGNLQIKSQLNDGNLTFVQKKVDMLIGLDTAHLSYNKIVDEIVFFCKDKDLSPAFKLARINGLQVSIVDLGGINISDHIYRHIDKVYKINNFSTFEYSLL